MRYSQKIITRSCQHPCPANTLDILTTYKFTLDKHAGPTTSENTSNACRHSSQALLTINLAFDEEVKLRPHTCKNCLVTYFTSWFSKVELHRGHRIQSHSCRSEISILLESRSLPSSTHLRAYYNQGCFGLSLPVLREFHELVKSIPGALVLLNLLNQQRPFCY